jgi:leader peptidase (prepilin peptidase)/N-methyltransferase
VAACGVIGVVIARVLLSMGVLKWSFADYEEYVQEDEPLAEYPHARREMVVELLYLLPVMLCVIIGGVIGMMLPAGGPPVFLQAIGASFLGYLAGAGLVWTVRILGTFAFGREAMGLGDVHLLGAVGAVFGWFDPILIFFIAPFIGLCWVLLTSLISAVSSQGRRELPYGPHLALATLLLFLCRPVVHDAWSALVPTVPMPQRALVEPESIFLVE